MSHDEHTPCTVIGAGPAGISAALWLRTFGVPFQWWARDGEIGGILSRVNNPIDAYPGGGIYPNGRAVVDDLEDHVDAIDELDPRIGTIETVSQGDERWTCRCEAGDTWSSETVVLTTGTTYRQLDVPGEQEALEGGSVSQSVTRDKEAFAGRTVGMVGGGDAGFEGAVELAKRGCHVHMLLRSADFRARPAFVDEARAHANVTMSAIPTVVERIEPLDDPRGCRVYVDVDGKRDTLEVACLFVRIGVEPTYPTLEPTPATDERHLVVDRRQKTSLEGLWAAGDVTDTQLPAVATAVGDGARAAHAVASHLAYV